MTGRERLAALVAKIRAEALQAHDLAGTLLLQAQAQDALADGLEELARRRTDEQVEAATKHLVIEKTN